MALMDEQGNILEPAPLQGTIDPIVPPEPAVTPTVTNYLEREQLKTLADPDGPFAALTQVVEEKKNRQAKQIYAQEQLEAVKAQDAQAMAGENQGTITPDEQAVAVTPGQTTTETESPMEIGELDPETGMPTWVLKEDATDEQVREYWDAVGSPEVGKAVTNPGIQGLVRTTSPIEMVASGIVGAGYLAGAAGLKLFMATVPLEFGGMLAGEEVGEDNWLVGLGIEVGTGVGVGAIADTVAKKTAPLFNRVADYFTKAPGQRAEEMATLAKNDAVRDFYTKIDANIEAATQEQITKAIEFPNGQGIDIPVTVQRAGSELAGLRAAQQALADLQSNNTEIKTPDIFTSSDYRYPANDSVDLNWKSRTTVNTRAQIEKDVIQGDLRNPVVKQVYTKTLSDIPEQNLAPAQAAEVQGVKTKIAAIDANPPKQEAKLDTPVAESGRSAVPRRVQTALHSHVSQSWYGKPIKSDKKAVEALAKRMRYAGQDPAGAQALYNKKKALGQYGELFQDDLHSTVQYEMNRLKRAGEPANYFDVLSRTERQLIQVYNKGIQDEVNLKAKTVNAESFLGQKNTYVEGPGESTDPKFPGMQGKITGTAASAKFEDWDIADHMRILPDSNTIQFDAPLSSTPVEPTFNKSKIFDYSTIGDSKQLNKEVSMFIRQGMLDKSTMKVDGFTVYGPVRKLKTADREYVDANGKVQSFKVLPDEEMESIAKLFQWSPSKVQPHGMIDAGQPLPPGGAFSMLPEDILKGRADKLDWEVTNPGYFDRVKARGKEDVSDTDSALEGRAPDMDAKAKAMLGADAVYQQQRWDYIVNAIKSRPGLSNLFNDRVKVSTSVDQAKKERNAINYIVDRIAVLRNQLADEMRTLENSPDSRNASKSYLMFQDLLSGSDTYYAANRITRDRGRSIARAEIETYGTQNIDPSDTEIRILELSERDGLSLEDATTKYYEDLLTNDEIPGQTARGRDRIPTPLASAEELAGSNRFAQIEDSLGVRFADDLYGPSVLPGQDGRINILRVNTVDDLSTLVQQFDKPVPAEFGEGSIANVLLDDLDPEQLVGIKAYGGHSQDAVNRLTTIISDVQDQTHEAAQIFSRHPEDPLSAIAFEKLQAIEGIFTSQLANGIPSSNSLDSLVRLDFSAGDNISGVNKVSDAVRNSYPVDIDAADGMIDTRVPLMQANMYLDMETAAQRGQFAREMAAIGDEYQPAATTREITQMREQLTAALRKACGSK